MSQRQAGCLRTTLPAAAAAMILLHTGLLQCFYLPLHVHNTIFKSCFCILHCRCCSSRRSDLSAGLLFTAAGGAESGLQQQALVKSRRSALPSLPAASRLCRSRTRFQHSQMNALC